MARKKNLALVFVSHCYTASKREHYLAELKKHMNVTDYGKCNWNYCRGEDCLLRELGESLLTRFYTLIESS